MPNYVYNRLTLYGPEADITRLNTLLLNGHKDCYEEETLDFSAILPMPADLPESEIRDWQIENWGCKWGATGLDWGGNDDSDCFDVFFQTPNSPAHGVMAALAAQFPTIEGEYSAGDPDMDWCCHNSLDGGQYEEGVRFNIEEQERICLGIAPEPGDDDYEDDEDDQEEDEDDEHEEEAE